MKYFQKLFSRKFYRSTLFWGLSLISLYTIIGFFVLPNIIHKTIVEQVELRLGWQTEIAKIEFNPYALTLSIEDLKIIDEQSQEQLSFKRYHINFELRSLIEGAFTFADIELTSPSITVEIDKNGITNFHHAILAQQTKIQPQPESSNQENQDNALPKLLFDNINVIAGNIDIVNHSASKTVKHQLNPITFNLKGLSTNMEAEGNYQLNIALGGGQTLNWNGTVALAPFRSSGSLDINGIMVHKLWNYMSDQAPYTLHNALAGFSGKYEISMANESPHFKIYQSLIQINDIELSNKQQTRRFSDIQAIEIGPLDFDLEDKKLQIATVKIDTANLLLERDKQGLLNILAPFADVESKSEPKPEEIVHNESSNSDSPWQWSIAEFVLENSQVDFIDQQPSTNAKIVINQINLKVEGINQDLSQSLPFQLSYYTDQSSENRIKGQVTPTPLNLEANLALNDFSLPTLQPYLSDLAKVHLEQGKLSVNGDLNLSADENGEIQGDYQGAFAIEEFNSKDKTIKQRLVGWQELAIDPVNINFNPLSVNISNIALIKPYLRLIVTEDRSINFAQLAINSDQTSAQKTPEKADGKQVKEKPLAIKIDKITLKDGSAYFADLSLNPQFGTSIQNMNGQIKGLSSDNLARADVDIAGSIEEYGKLLIKGKINPLGGDLYTDIDANFDKIELTTLTPYSGRYVGYVIDKGKLSLLLNYKIANNQLDGSNRLILDQFELGSSVDSPESLNLPLKLALALFKDSDGIIDISLPTKGDMNNPDFEISGLVMKAFLNVITKAVTSPFSMIANIANGDAEQLNTLAFNLGSAALTKDNIAQLDTLAVVLNKRPQLILEIRAIVDEEQDGLVLKQQKLDALLEQYDIDNLEQQQRFSIIEQQLIEHNAETELMKLKNDLQLAIESTAKVEVSKEEDNTVAKSEPSVQETLINEYEQSLYQTLLSKQPLQSLELSQLAQQRISIIKAQLIKHDKVNNEQVFALQPSLDGQAQENTISTIFSLTAD